MIKISYTLLLFEMFLLFSDRFWYALEKKILQFASPGQNNFYPIFANATNT